jgi:hypothetical protein
VNGIIETGTVVIHTLDLASNQGMPGKQLRLSRAKQKYSVSSNRFDRTSRKLLIKKKNFLNNKKSGLN